MNQNFKTLPPYSILMTLLHYCIDNKQYFICNYESYKRLLFHDKYDKILEALRPHYHTSKQFYIDRKLTYTSFTNILRQLCKIYNKTYTWKVKNTLGKTFLEYYIYI